MDRKSFVVKRVYKVFFMILRVLSDDGKYIYAPYEGFGEKDPVCTNPELRQSLLNHSSGESHKYAIYDDEGYLYAVLREGGENIIWGPFVFEARSEFQDRTYLSRNHVKDKEIFIPQTNAGNLKNILSFIHGLYFEEYRDEDDLFESADLFQETERLNHNISEYIMDNKDAEKDHFSYEKETIFFEKLTTGKIDEKSVLSSYPGDLDEYRDLSERQGKIALSTVKSVEYTIVSFITILTRYAIRAGARETEAYLLSDVALQELSKAVSIEEMERIARSSVMKFIQMLKENRKDKVLSLYVVQSKNYIARHIFEKITLQDVADEVGVHPNYLSRLFSAQTGSGIQRYIMREKISVACNLLKYSDKSIAVIADYMSMSPQSYFTRNFKKIMHQTPAEYRKKHKTSDF